MPLLEEDTLYLQRKNYVYTVDEDTLGNLYLRIYHFPLPKGYSHADVTLLVIIPILYPLSKLDCFYIKPFISITHAEKRIKPRNAQFYEEFLGEYWQIFSRHLPQWRPEVDRLQHFLILINKILQDEAANEINL